MGFPEEKSKGFNLPVLIPPPPGSLNSEGEVAAAPVPAAGVEGAGATTTRAATEASKQKRRDIGWGVILHPRYKFGE